MPRPKDRYGTRGALLKRLWTAIKKTSRLLDSEDPQVVLRATHALATIASAYRAAYAEWEEEQARKRGQEAKNPPKQIDPYVLWIIKRDVYGLSDPPPQGIGPRPPFGQEEQVVLEAHPLPALEGKGEDGKV